MKTLNYRDAVYMLIVTAGLLTGYFVTSLLTGTLRSVDPALVKDDAHMEIVGCRTVLHDAAMQGDMIRLNAYLGREKLHHMLDGHWWGAAPLHLAAEKGHAEAVVFLIEQGADMEATDAKGRTAIHAAALNGHVDVVAALLDAGADPKAQFDVLGLGYTARRCAVDAGYGELGRLLEEFEADLETADALVPGLS